jgi:hypothetical protein
MTVPFARFRIPLGRASRAGGFVVRRLRDADEKHVLWATAGIALVVRVVFVIGMHPLGTRIFSDMSVYDMRADHLLHGPLGPWDTFTPIGYPAFLALVFALFGKAYALIGLLQATMGAATAVLANRVAKLVSLSSATARVAGLAVALYFPLVYYAGLLLTEASTAFLLVLLAWLLLRAAPARSILRIAVAATALAITVAVRPNVALVVPLLLPWAWASHRGDRRRACGLFLGLVVFSMPLLLLVCVHNSRLLHRPAGLATNGGLNFYLARAEVSGAVFQEGDFQHRITPIPNVMNYAEPFVSPVPLYDEAYFYRLGLADVAQRPSSLVTSLRNLSEGLGLGRQGFWPAWQSRAPMHVLFARGVLLAIVPAFLSLLWLVFRRQIFAPEQSGRLLLFSFCLSCVAALYLFLGDPRVRVPFDPFFLILGVDACALALASFRRSRLRAANRGMQVVPPRANRGAWVMP